MTDAGNGPLPNATLATSSQSSLGNGLADLLARYAPPPSAAGMLQRITRPTSAGHEGLPSETPSATPDIEPEETAEAESTDSEPHEFDWMARFSRPVPSYEEQIKLAQSIEAGVLARGVLSGEVVVPFGTPEEMAVLVREGESALEELLLGNLKLVLYWPRRSTRMLELADRFQYGFFGLLRAIERWDWRRGYAFSTYASWHVRQQINRGIANDAYTIRLPVHIQDQLRARDVGEAGATEDAVEATSDQDTRAAAIRVLRGIWSLDAISDLLEDTCDPHASHDDPAEWLPERLTLEEAVQDALESLDERSREVLERRAGMYDSPETLEDIGKRWGVTRERVRQVESKAESLARARLWRFGAEHPLPQNLRNEALPVQLAVKQGVTFGRGLSQLAEVWGWESADLSRRIRAVLATVH